MASRTKRGAVGGARGARGVKGVKGRRGKDPLSVLEVIDALEVGPVRVEPRRLAMPYRVLQRGRWTSTDMRYTFGEDVFDPDEPESVNLAGMMAVQVALNYGLFCKRMVFKGAFDRHDRAFITRSMDMTSQEIFVIKFLMENPFLLGEAAHLPPVRRKVYTRARVEFADPLPSPITPAAPWGEGTSKHAVLSSGGKDSLLSLGLLEEMGRDVHAIFGTESGRHWYTALNAYRHLRDTRPSTARVWMNSDRVFSWMLRHLPFVRQDFANVRSDEYPVRLWTVAVFIFGALPLLRKRGIGRIVIGDEHDTTYRLRHRGILHYKAVYDQSRYFDEAMTRYYRAKGWGVDQFSIIRPLSEMLIEKVLATRYPGLQEHQVSCHAAHIGPGSRVHPCGACEKCRRVVAMLTADGIDPGRCGYSREQVAACIRSLATQDMHHERVQAEHLAFLLRARGMLPGGAIGSARAREHPEVLKMRYDPERSPLRATPRDLRVPFVRIILEHSGGALKRVGGRWVDFEPIEDPDIERPYLTE